LPPILPKWLFPVSGSLYTPLIPEIAGRPFIVTSVLVFPIQFSTDQSIVFGYISL